MSSFELVEVPLSDRKLVERFIRVPWYVHREHHPSPRWVPPLLMDRRDYLNPDKNPFFKHVQAAFWIARKDGRDVARVAAVRDEDFVKFHGLQTGYLGMFECPDDPELAQALVDTAKAWLAARGCTAMIGPFELSMNYISGVLVEGFDRDPGINLPYNPPYYDRLLQGTGMAKAKDLLHWGIDPQRPIPERVAKIAAKVAERRGITIRDMRFDDWDAEVLRSLEVMNDAWEKNWGFVPVGREEYLHIAKDLKMVLEPGLPIIAEVKGEPVAFVITILDVNPVLKKLDGRLFPFGIVRLLWDLKVRKVVKGGRLILLGIKAAYRGQGIDTLLFLATHRAAQRLGWTEGQIGWTLEDNDRVNAAVKNMGGYPIAKYRVYETTL
ncbi:N-acetyltransferase [Nannocystis sp. RBIL2]|uniref:N-acetyltransferase n=1 Tax=Nannocystis sp. RBIL2 TaxID=2996788 RepID=UPI002270C60F|nr:N-acetyltransferase [Nannocystis sp. RBIL2]MCY1067492.1 N-acetyltransferase [Nannocystis sp. RBIL2]